MLTRSQDVWNKLALLKIVDASFRVGRKSLDNVEIQKITFLSEMEGHNHNLKTAYYKFYRDKHGPYSKTLANTVNQLEKLGMIDQETREMRDRGKHLLRYVWPELENSKSVIRAVASIDRVAEGWKDVRGWTFKEKVYELSFPIQQYEWEKRTMHNVPLYTDILDPETTQDLEIDGIDVKLIEDIEEEFATPLLSLDKESEEFREAVTQRLHLALSL